MNQTLMVTIGTTLYLQQNTFVAKRKRFLCVVFFLVSVCVCVCLCASVCVCVGVGMGTLTCLPFCKYIEYEKAMAECYVHIHDNIISLNQSLEKE